MIRNVIWVTNRYWRFFESYERCGVPRSAKQLYAAAAALVLGGFVGLMWSGALGFLWLLVSALLPALTGFAWAYRYKLLHIRYRVSRICGAPCHSYSQAKRLMLKRYQRRYGITNVRETVKFIEEATDKCMQRREFDQFNHYQWQVLSLSWLKKLGTTPWWLISAVAAGSYFAADKAFALTDGILNAIKANPALLAVGPILLILLLLLTGQIIAITAMLLNLLNQRVAARGHHYSRQRLHYLLGDVVYYLAQK